MNFIYLKSLFITWMVNLDPTYWPAPSWLVNSVGRALHWYCRGHGFKSRTGLKFFSGPIFNYYFSSVVSCEDLLNSSKCVTTISLTVNLVKFRANWHKHDKVDKVVRKHSYCAFYRVSNCSRDEETSHALGKATHKKTWLNSVLINV